MPEFVGFENSIEVEIEGIISIPNTMTYEHFHTKFIEWVEENGFAFGGSTALYEPTDDEPNLD